MSGENYTTVTEFILLGLTDSPELQIILFILFLVIYTLTLMGNSGMITLIKIDSQLHTPIYFFLTNLSFNDIFYSSTITPKMLADLLSERKVISFAGCFLQLYVFIALTTTECILFGLMAYDRYAAICNPLLYPVIMSRAVCLKMAMGAFTAGFLNSIIHTSYISASRDYRKSWEPLRLAHSCWELPWWRRQQEQQQQEQKQQQQRFGDEAQTVSLEDVSGWPPQEGSESESDGKNEKREKEENGMEQKEDKEEEEEEDKEEEEPPRKKPRHHGFILDEAEEDDGAEEEEEEEAEGELGAEDTMDRAGLPGPGSPEANPREDCSFHIHKRTINRERFDMATWNHTGFVKEFFLVGLTEIPELQVPLFLLFFVIYVVTLVGNWGMIIIICMNAQLHTPMYFFLSNLSLCDICYSTVFAPKMLVNFLVENKVSSFASCVLQSFFFAVYVTTEGILLSMMAYDRYEAIANPLLYTVIMTQRVCILMVLVSYLVRLINSLTHTIGLLRLNFCGPNVINHYFCDIPPLLKLSCSDAHLNDMLLLVFSGVIAMITFIIIMVSYIHILIAILRIKSAEGRRKAFSTCASHLTAVTLFYGSVTFSYIQPSSQYSLEEEKVSAVFYTLIIPMLNPLIYSLRNKEVKDAAKRSIARKSPHN
ncbi:uncharacterized protein ACOB8E_005144 [Sarcophilus harrisii]